ncbi:MAG: bactofilin family protein [Solirubrobacterales bacterium]
MLQKLVNAGGRARGLSPARPAALSVIGPDVRIVGDIITQGEMQIDGQVDGDITCQTLVVGEGARIVGAVAAETVRVHGELDGKINATTVLIARTARVTGDITHESIEIEAGAFLEGHVLRSGSAPRPESREPAAKDASTKEPEAKKANGAGHPSPSQGVEESIVAH